MTKVWHMRNAALAALVIVALSVLLAACGGGSHSAATTSGSPAVAGPAFTPRALSGDTIVGAGATFPYPLYSKWASDYQGLAGVKLNYQAIGSGGGIAQIEAKTVDFGASDAPLTPSDLQANNLVQFPATVGGDVPVINVGGIGAGQLKLTGDVLAKIFLGRITTWNGPAIAALNPGMNLPATQIMVVHRSDGSGTSWIFTNYLFAVSSDWKSKVGAGTEVSWPTGVGGKGNSGVAAYVQQINGSIGYVEYAYAVQNGMNYVQMENKAGSFVKPSLATFEAAAEHADWAKAPGFYLALVDQPGATSWPITGASFILMQKDQTEAARAKMVLKFFDWAFKNGQATSQSLDYVSLPASAVSLIEKTWSKDLSANGSPVWP